MSAPQKGTPRQRTVMVVPTLDEAENLPTLVPAFFAALPHAHLLVVDDGSPDGTGDVCLELARRYPRLHLLRRQGPRGLGRAYLAGIEWALRRGFEVIGTMDADSSHDPAHLPAMVAALAEHDVVVGARYVSGGGIENWPLARVLLSRVANTFAALLLGLPLRDVTSGFRLYRAAALRRLDLAAITSNGYSFLAELLFRLRRTGATIQEVPIRFRDRRMGRSKLAPREIWIGALRLLRLRATHPRAAPARALHRRAAREPRAPRPVRIAAGLSATVALLVAVAAPALLLPLTHRTPSWDQWSMVEVFQASADGRSVWPLLLKPYNGHLNVIPRLIFYLVGRLSHWNVRLEVVLSFAFGAVTLAVLWRMLRETRRELGVLAAAAAALVFSFAQFENYLSGYPMGQVLSQCAVTATVYLLTRQELGRRALAAALAGAAIATFSWGAGAVLWPLGAGVLLLRSRWRAAAVWAVTSVPALWLVRRGAAGLGIVWPKVPHFALAVLGTAMPPHALPSHELAAANGLALSLLFFVCLAWLWRRGEDRLVLVRWLTVGGSAIGSALLIAFGRAWADPVVAVASHYATASYPLVLADLVLLALIVLGPQPAPTRRLVSVTAGAFVVVAHVAWVSAAVYAMVRVWQPYVDAVESHVEAGRASDAEIASALHQDTAMVRSSVEFLRRTHMAMFRDP